MILDRRILLVFVFCAAMFHTLGIFYFNQLLNKTNEEENDELNYIQKKRLNFNTSIAFYTIIGARQNFPPEHDLRGKFWEFQLANFPYNYSLHYLCDGPFNINNVNCLVLPEGSTSYEDRKLCIRTHQSWKHFVENNLDKKWYFRGTHDTFINMTALELMLMDLESKLDPMKEFGLVYNVHEYNYKLYPHGGTGWLFSNYAVRQFFSKEKKFLKHCDYIADDVGMAPFMEEVFNLTVLDYVSNQFIVTWPNTEGEIIYQKQYERVRKCPKAYHLYPHAPGLIPCPARTAVSIHMHHVPMDEAWTLLNLTPENFSVTYPVPSYPTFCQNSDV